MKEKISSLPSSPGVYLMKDSLGGIIYVGKSKNLKKRVQSYFHHSKAHPPKVKKLVSHIRDLEHRVTDTEFEAFMLECRLIRELKPMYNKKMKNPLAYTYISIQTRDGLRRIAVTGTPGGNEDRIDFGPYSAGKHSVERAVQTFLESYRIACTHARPNGSACLNHSLGLCLGMCLGGEAVAAYNGILDRFIALMNGSDRSLYLEIERRMRDASEDYDFEKAATYRDCLESLNFILNKEKMIDFTEKNRRIVIIEHLSPERVKLFLVRRNQILHSEQWTVDPSGMESLRVKVEAAILSHFAADSSVNTSPLSREEIDEAQIIYTYLQSGAGRWLLIPEEWLKPGGHGGLEAALRSTLS